MVSDTAAFILSDGSKSMNADFDLGGNNLDNVGTVNGNTTANLNSSGSNNVNLQVNGVTQWFINGNNGNLLSSGGDLNLIDNDALRVGGISEGTSISSGNHFINLSGTDLDLSSDSVTNQIRLGMAATAKWQVATNGSGNGTFTTYLDAGPDSFSITGDLWRSSTTTDELKYNDGAVVQLS